MDAQQRGGLARLSSLQIALLAVMMSTIMAVGVLIAVRMLMGGNPAPEGLSTAGEAPAGAPDGNTAFDSVQPAVDTEMTVEIPHHFTEDLIVPGLTETGQDVLRDDDTLGRSPEGV